MMKKQKLELTWVGKENRPRLEPRILLEDPETSYHAAQRVSDADIFDNRLIFGDNLLALKALEQEFAGKVKCVFIDPPYNTGSAFEHYDDGLEHSIWLSLMRDRLEIIRRLLSDEGSLWVTLDDNEAHYFRVLGDEVLGRGNFVADIAWQKKYAPGNNEKGISSDHDHVLLWTKNRPSWAWNLLPRSDKQDAAYKNPDNDPRGIWKASDLTRSEHRDRDFYPIITPSGKSVTPAAGRSWSRPPEEIERLRADNRLWFGPRGDAKPSLKRFLTDVQEGIVARTIWLRDEVGDNEQAKKEAKQFNDRDIFATPKPEKLLQRVIQIATNPGDLVLDSFAGSGTTGAIAHKMGRRWIMVELGEHCHTHIIPRLRKVIDGEDKGGITEAVGWQGGGGFRYYRLAPSLLEIDKWGREVIAKAYNAAMLAEALCKLEGFTYAPSDAVYWQQGHSTERDFIYVTTQTLSHEQLQQLSEEVGRDRSLLVLCSAFRGNPEHWPNLTVKKIPNHIRARCEWGHDDYSLNVENLPRAAPRPASDATAPSKAKPKQPDLFGVTEGGSK
ncbi:DNA methylase N-4 [uncultured Defluviicoccus sp.]|uniref:DNA methylase N-4 n=1 Tax=metagenome TaxID=256318 RepID=A0A380TB61_9ZZZZ|nr:DNA methylase N-4 [uncultured Defluviicoccus sp.]